MRNPYAILRKGYAILKLIIERLLNSKTSSLNTYHTAVGDAIVWLEGVALINQKINVAFMADAFSMGGVRWQGLLQVAKAVATYT